MNFLEIKMCILWILVGVACLSGCATVEKSTGFGVVVGGTLGGVIGSNVGSENATSAALGAVIGAVAGGIMGHAGYEDNKRKKEMAQFETEKVEVPSPELRDAVVRRVWVPAKIEGLKYIGGHFMFVIERPSEWRSNE